MVAIVIGSTGLVGSELTNQLINSEQFEKVKIFTRRPFEIKHSKLEEHVIDFDLPKQWQQLVTGDVLFSVLGTTLKKAGSQGAQFKVDYTYQYYFARAAVQNGVPNYVLVSAAYASPTSRIFYSRVKGILEKDIKKLSFQHITILKPGMLAGNRKENRPGEKLGIPILDILSRIPGLSSLKPVPAATVARAMMNAVSYHPSPVNEYSLGEVFKLASVKNELT